MQPAPPLDRLIVMNADLSVLHGAMNRRELLAAGFSDHELRSAVRSGELVSLASGVLIRPELLDGTPEGRHRELATAWVRRTSAACTTLGGVSAAALLGLPVWGLDTTRVTMVDPGRTPGTRTSAVARIVTDLRPAATVDVGGVRVTTAARTVVDIGRTAERGPAVAVGDAALRAHLCTREELDTEIALAAGMKGAARARRVVAELDGLAESVLESRSRIVILDAGLPPPKLQVDLHHDDGFWVARVDFYWPEHRVVGECDGVAKYGGSDGQRRMLYEKARTDMLVELGNRVLHWGWRDLDDPTQLIRRLRHILGG